MEKKRQWNLRGRIVAMAILAFALLLAGWGKETTAVRFNRPYSEYVKLMPQTFEIFEQKSQKPA